DFVFDEICQLLGEVDVHVHVGPPGQVPAGMPNHSIFRHRPGNARRQTGRQLRPQADDAGQLRQAPARRPATWDADLHTPERRWDRPTGPGAATTANVTLICDLDRRRTIALLPDREPDTA